MAGLLRSFHPFPTAIVVLTAAMLAFVADSGPPPVTVLIRVLGVVLASQISVGALNDYLDRDADAAVQPDKPIPSGLVRPRSVLILSVLAGCALVPAALSFGPASLAVALLGLCAGLAYDLWLERTPAGACAYVVGFLSLVGWIWLVTGHFTWRLAILLPPGLLLIVAAYLANVLPDIETDRALGHTTLAVLLGRAGTTRVLLACAAAAWLGAVSAAFVLQSPIAGAVALISGLALALAQRRFTRPDLSARDSDMAFRMMAPALGALAASLLLALRAVT